MRDRTIRRTLALALLVVATSATACLPSDVWNLKVVKAGTRCTSPGAFARDSSRVLQCSTKRRWAVNMSIAQAVAMIQEWNIANTPTALDRQIPGWTQTHAGDGLTYPVRMRVLNTRGAPVARQTVRFSQSGRGNVTFVGPTEVVTGPDGVAATTVTPGTTAGGVTIRVDVVGSFVSANQMFAVDAAEADRWVIESGDDQATTVTTAFTVPLVAKLVDRFGNGVPLADLDVYVTAGLTLYPHIYGTYDTQADGSGRFGVSAWANSGPAPRTEGVMFEFVRDDGTPIDVSFDLSVTS